MPRLIPEAPSFVTESERLVWEALRGGLGPDDVLIASLRITDERKDHEADLVVLMPDLGVVVLEVKGGSVWYDDGWWIKRGGEDTRVDPVAQARDSKYALRTFVEQRWSRGRVAWAHGVVAPHSTFDPDFAVPDLPRVALHDLSSMEDLAAAVRENAVALAQGARAPSADEVDLVVDVLTGAHASFDVVAEAAEREATADRLTQEQAMLLRVTRLIHRVEVRGGAGSGKTMLALAQAKQLTRGTADVPARRVALLCYSLGLAEFLKREVASWGRRERPAFVGTFHEFGVQWGAPAQGDRQDSHFWEVELPETMAELAAQLPDGHRYDAIVVDEAQDFADLWWQPLLKSMRDEERVRSLRLQRREPTDLRPLRQAPRSAGAAGSRPQLAQHQADPRSIWPDGPEPDVCAGRGWLGCALRRVDGGGRRWSGRR